MGNRGTNVSLSYGEDLSLDNQEPQKLFEELRLTALDAKHSPTPLLPVFAEECLLCMHIMADIAKWKPPLPEGKAATSEDDEDMEENKGRSPRCPDYEVFVGLVYLTRTPEQLNSGEANVGIIISKPYRRRGYAREALELVLATAFEVFQLHRVQASIIDTAVKHRPFGLLMGLGFQHEGTRRRAVYVDWEVEPGTGAEGAVEAGRPLRTVQGWTDVTCLAMLDTEWSLRGVVGKGKAAEGKGAARKSLWDEMFLRHAREREELVMWEERRTTIRRTDSSETIRQDAVMEASAPAEAPVSRIQSGDESFERHRAEKKELMKRLSRWFAGSSTSAESSVAALSRSPSVCSSRASDLGEDVQPSDWARDRFDTLEEGPQLPDEQLQRELNQFEEDLKSLYGNKFDESRAQAGPSTRPGTGTIGSAPLSNIFDDTPPFSFDTSAARPTTFGAAPSDHAASRIRSWTSDLSLLPGPEHTTPFPARAPSRESSAASEFSFGSPVAPSRSVSPASSFGLFHPPPSRSRSPSAGSSSSFLSMDHEQGENPFSSSGSESDLIDLENSYPGVPRGFNPGGHDAPIEMSPSASAGSLPSYGRVRLPRSAEVQSVSSGSEWDMVSDPESDI